MLTLYGNKVSSNTARVKYVLELLQEPYTYKEIDLQKEAKQENYLKMHPLGKVPTIDDNGFILFESNAINRYLCNKRGSTLYPKEVKARALVDQWNDFVTIHIGSAVGKVTWNRVIAPMLKQPVSEEEIKKGLQEIEKMFPILNEKLQKGPYLVGSALSLADINLLAILFYAEAAKINLTKYKAVLHWRKDLQAMEFYKKIHQQ